MHCRHKAITLSLSKEVSYTKFVMLWIGLVHDRANVVGGTLSHDASALWHTELAWAPAMHGCKDLHVHVAWALSNYVAIISFWALIREWALARDTTVHVSTLDQDKLIDQCKWEKLRELSCGLAWHLCFLLRFLIHEM